MLLGLSAGPAWAVVSPILSGTVLGQTSVRLDWTDGGDEQQYLVFRDGVQIATVAKNILTYTNTGLSPGTTYQFRVDAKKGRNVAPSNVIPLTTDSPPPPPPAPTVDSFSPIEGDVGVPVTVTGTNFTDATATRFNGVSAAFTVDSATQISTAVPSGATTGPISVTTPGGTGTSAASFTVTNPPPPACVGVQVPFDATVGYLNTVIPGNGAQTYCLAAGTYEMGSSTALHFDSGDSIIGQPVTFGPLGEVFAPTAIHSTAQTGVIEAGTGDTTLTVENLDLCCAPGAGNQFGNGIDGQFETLRNLTVRNSRIHGNASTGITGVAEGLVVENSEIDHNGSGSDSVDAGIKTVHYAVIRGVYFHDNFRRGMWWDCDVPGGIIENSRLTGQTGAAIHVEISSGDSSSPRPLPPGASYGFVIRGNIVDGNNTGNQGGNAGILVVSSRNVMIDGNTTTNNGVAEITVLNDSRQNNGHNGCSSGFPASNVTVQNNQYGPLEIAGCTLTGVTCVNNTKIL